MTVEMTVCLAIFLFMVIGYVFSSQLKTTTGIIALCVICLTSFTGLVEPKQVLANFGSSNVILISGMFVVAAGFNRTQAVKKLSAAVYKISGGSFVIMLGGYLLIGAALAQFVPSPLAVYTIMAPLVASMCVSVNVSPSKAMFPLCLAIIGTCQTLPVGGGATVFAQLNGYLESYGYTEFQVGILQPFFGRFPVMIILLLYSIFIAPKFAPDTPPVPITNGAASSRGAKEQEPLGRVQEFFGYAVFVLTTVALIFQKSLGTTSWQIALTGAAVIMITGVLKPREAINSLPIRILLMLIAALTIGGAMIASGLGDVIGNGLAAAMGGTDNGYIIGAAFFIIPFLLTQLMQNQSVLNIFVPIVILTCQTLDCSPIGPLILLYASTLTAFMTPMATGTIPVVMEYGGYDTRSLIKQGWLPSVIICIVSVLWVMTIFPA